MPTLVLPGVQCAIGRLTSRSSQYLLKLSSGTGHVSIYGSTRSSRTTIGKPWTRRKSMSLVMKIEQPDRRAVEACRASGVFKPVSARRRAASSHS